MQTNAEIIQTDKFTLIPKSMPELKSFLNTHLGGNLLEVININHYSCECKIKTETGEKTISVSLPAHYVDYQRIA